MLRPSPSNGTNADDEMMMIATRMHSGEYIEGGKHDGLVNTKVGQWAKCSRSRRHNQKRGHHHDH